MTDYRAMWEELRAVIRRGFPMILVERDPKVRKAIERASSGAFTAVWETMDGIERKHGGEKG